MWDPQLKNTAAGVKQLSPAIVWSAFISQFNVLNPIKTKEEANDWSSPLKRDILAAWQDVSSKRE